MKAIGCVLWGALFLLVNGAPSQALNIGDDAPLFTLKSHEGRDVSLADYKGKIVVLEWFNAGCPFVRKHYASGNMQSLQEEFGVNKVVWLTINSTSPEHKDYLTPADTKAKYQEWKMKSGAVLFDPDGKVGRAYGAKTTPQIFIISAKGRLVYRGAIDNQPDPDANPKEATNFVRPVIHELMNWKPVTVPETKAYGCSIKY